MDSRGNSCPGILCNAMPPTSFDDPGTIECGGGGSCLIGNYCAIKNGEVGCCPLGSDCDRYPIPGCQVSCFGVCCDQRSDLSSPICNPCVNAQFEYSGECKSGISTSTSPCASGDVPCGKSCCPGGEGVICDNVTIPGNSFCNIPSEVGPDPASASLTVPANTVLRKRQLLGIPPAFGRVDLAFYETYIVFNVTLINLEGLWGIFGNNLGNVTLSHMHLMDGNSSNHLAYFVGDDGDVDDVELPRSGDFLLASGELALDELELPYENVTDTSVFVSLLPSIYADIHTTTFEPPLELLSGFFA